MSSPVQVQPCCLLLRRAPDASRNPVLTLSCIANCVIRLHWSWPAVANMIRSHTKIHTLRLRSTRKRPMQRSSPRSFKHQMVKDKKGQEAGSEGAGAAGPSKVCNAISKLPRKKFFRSRAHSNPLSDSVMTDIPLNPSSMDWSSNFPAFLGPEASSSGQAEAPKVRFADIGCGFGGLLIRLATLYPDTLMVGMELRDKVSTYVKERIGALRRENPGQYGNITCLRTNAMKYLPHYFEKGQLTKMFFLFPDPHFKTANHRRRIINTTLITEYAYLMAPGGMLYTITDVKDLGDWMRAKLLAHPMFELVSDEELEHDPAANLLTDASEEGQKVARNKGDTHRAVFRRLAAPKWSNLEHAAVTDKPASKPAAADKQAET